MYLPSIYYAVRKANMYASRTFSTTVYIDTPWIYSFLSGMLRLEAIKIFLYCIYASLMFTCDKWRATVSSYVRGLVSSHLAAIKRLATTISLQLRSRNILHYLSYWTNDTIRLWRVRSMYTEVLTRNVSPGLNRLNPQPCHCNGLPQTSGLLPDILALSQLAVARPRSP